mgnify:CR=1 FL=1
MTPIDWASFLNDANQWLKDWAGLTVGDIVRALVIVLAGHIVIKTVNAVVERVIRRHWTDGHLDPKERRAQTLAAVLKSVMRYSIDFIAIVTVLRLFKVDTTSILAGAGIVGLAVGFGAQNLVRDIITGFFIIFEDQFGVGDYITATGLSGTVEELGLRITRLRDFGGELHIIPNGIIDKVTNHSRGAMRALVDVSVAYEEDIDHVLQVLTGVSRKMAEERKEIIAEGPTPLGVINFGPSEVVIRIVAKARAMAQWEVERELRKRIKEAFDREGIEIPYARQVWISADRTKIAAGVPRSTDRPPLGPDDLRDPEGGAAK